jgi:hypothetical protein
MLLSPKFQIYNFGDPLLLSVNFTVNGAFREMGEAEKAATRTFKAFTTTFTLSAVTTGLIKLPVSSSSLFSIFLDP